MPTHNPDDVNQVTAPIDLALKMAPPQEGHRIEFWDAFPGG